MLPSLFFDITSLQFFDVKLVSMLQFSMFPYSMLPSSIKIPLLTKCFYFIFNDMQILQKNNIYEKCCKSDKYFGNCEKLHYLTR